MKRQRQALARNRFEIDRLARAKELARGEQHKAAIDAHPEWQRAPERKKASSSISPTASPSSSGGVVVCGTCGVRSEMTGCAHVAAAAALGGGSPKRVI